MHDLFPPPPPPTIPTSEKLAESYGEAEDIVVGMGGGRGRGRGGGRGSGEGEGGARSGSNERQDTQHSPCITSHYSIRL